ncbi:hypothetical protein [Actinotalea ferrariae]|nr:hypothetical protein [Actinotalea ferrariae]
MTRRVLVPALLALAGLAIAARQLQTGDPVAAVVLLAVFLLLEFVLSP